MEDGVTVWEVCGPTPEWADGIRWTNRKGLLGVFSDRQGARDFLRELAAQRNEEMEFIAELAAQLEGGNKTGADVLAGLRKTPWYPRYRIVRMRFASLDEARRFYAVGAADSLADLLEKVNCWKR